MGTAYKALLPYQTFHTKTRDIAIGVGSDRLWQVFCPAIGLALRRRCSVRDQRGAVGESSRARRRAAGGIPHEGVRGLGADLIEAGVPVGAINTIGDLVQHPQVRARGALIETKHPTAGRLRVVGPPTRLSETPGVLRRAAPLLGEHTREILRDIGIDAAELARHEASGVIACAG